jgi:hypothetical protein
MYQVATSLAERMSANVCDQPGPMLHLMSVGFGL